MMSVHILCVGKLKEDWLRSAQAEYLKRLGAFCRPEVVEVPEYRLPEEPSPAQIQRGLEEEGRALLAKAAGTRIALCIEGKELSSPALSDWIFTAGTRGESEFSFLIGGSFGLSDTVKQSAALRLSMSPMTFPHQLARILLLEQLYRACSIHSNGKYHK